MNWGLTFQLQEAKREIAALRDQIKLLTRRMRMMKDELALKAPRVVWVIVESHWDERDVVYVASSEEQAEKWAQARREENSQRKAYCTFTVSVVKMAVDGDEV